MLLPDQAPELRRGRLKRQFYAYKGDKKPKKAEVVSTPSSYAGVNDASFATDFGSGSSGLVTNDNGSKTYSTTAKLSQPLADVAGTAGQGLMSNMQYLQADPTQQVDRMRQGTDPYYNVLKETMQRERDAAVGRQLVDAQQGGLTNSTTLGSALGKIANEDILRQNQALLQALDYGNQNARANAQFGLGTITGLNSLVTPLGSAAAAQLQSAKASQDAAAAATAKAQNDANTEYTAAMNAYRANSGVDWGSVGGLAGGLLGGTAGFFLGGPAGALTGYGLGSGVGGGIGGGIGGIFGGSKQPAQAYVPTSGASYFNQPALQAQPVSMPLPSQLYSPYSSPSSGLWDNLGVLTQ